MRAALCFALALGACDVVQDTADTLARDRAKTVVNAVVAENLPGVDASPVTDCIIDAASAQEILRIAASATGGANGETVNLILNIAQRPQAVQCIAASQLRGFQT